MNLSYLPNLITGVRCLLVLPIAWALIEGRYFLALTLFVVAGVTDGIDGYIAKRFDWQSKLGGILDPLADKFLLVTSLIILASNDIIPAWLVIAAVLRDVLIVAGATIYYFWIAHFTAAPTYLSKMNTVLQIVLVFWMVLVQIWPQLDRGISEILVLLTMLSIIASGAQYVIEWGVKAWKIKSLRGRNASA